MAAPLPPPAAGETINVAVRASFLGSILVAGSAAGVCAILLGDDPVQLLGALRARFPRASLVLGSASAEDLATRVAECLEAPAQAFNLDLDLRGTAFQCRVWRALADIPPGATATYSEIATRIGHPGAARAVASACASNLLAFVVPCHRVVGTGGALTGYRWGLDRKQTLLDRERAATVAVG